MFVTAFMAIAIFSLLVLFWHPEGNTPDSESEVGAGGLLQRRPEDPFMENRVTRASIF